MKTSLCSAGLLVFTVFAAFAEDPEVSIVEKGFNHRVLEWVRTPGGGEPIIKGGYTELETGMYFVGANGDWQASEAVIEITPNGAAALKGNHQVHFLSNLNAPGAVDLLMRDGQRLTSRILGLGYFDSATGQSVLIAELKDSAGVLHPPNQLIYSDAFTDLKADVRYTYTKAGFEQDVIFREQFPTPTDYGLNPLTTRLQLFTEFIDPPAPRIEKQQQGERQIDVVIDFGVMQMGVGKAFSLGQEERQISVEKSWSQLNGRQFLIEEIDFERARGYLEKLPLPGQAMTKPKVNGVRHLVSNERLLPRRNLGSATPSGSIQVAHASLPQPGFVLDYSLMASATNFTFQGDTTYYVSGLVNLSSNTVIEGGAVVKFTNYNGYVNRSINISGTIDCQTGPYRPAVFTSKDDDTVGKAIPGSSGTPSGYYGDGVVVNSSGNTLHHLRCAYLQTAITGVPITGDLKLAHLQFVFCKYPIRFSPFTCGLFGCQNTLTLDNALLYSCETAFTGENGAWNGQHVTVHDCNTLTDDPGNNASLNLTNSLLATVTNWGNMPSNLVSVAQYTSDSGIFQTVGAGSHYLANGSTNRNAGTTNITSSLSSDLKEKTTYPPLESSSATIVSDTCWTPHVLRDVDLPDRGFHYDPLDFGAGNVSIESSTTNTVTLTIAPGTAVGAFGTKGIILKKGGVLECCGSPVKLNHVVHYNTVQEQSTSTWSSSTVGVSVFSDVPLEAETNHFTATVCSSFTTWSVLGQDRHFEFNDGLQFFRMSDCQVFGGGIISQFNNSVVEISNTLFENVRGRFTNETSQVRFRNNLFFGGEQSWNLPGTNASISFRDNFYQRISVSGTNVDYLSNAFVNVAGPYPFDTNQNIFLTNLVFQTGPLGSYYQPTNSPLLNRGSRSANDAELCRRTTITNQVQEGSSQVDIGLHYVPVQNIEEIPKSSFTLTASSSATGHSPSEAGDNQNVGVGWLNNVSNENPAWLRVDLGSSKPAARVDYYPPENAGAIDSGTYLDYALYVTDSSSSDTNNWGSAVSTGTWHWPNGAELKTIEFTPKSGRYVILRCLSGQSNYAGCNEIYIFATNNSGAVWTPLDTDTNGSPDYVEGCAPLVFTNAINLRVDVEDSQNCSGSNSQRQIREDTILFSGGKEDWEYVLAVGVEGNVETQTADTYDRVYVNNMEFFRGTESGSLCFMRYKAVTNQVTIIPCVKKITLKYDTIDEQYHTNAFARIISITLVSSNRVENPCR